MHDLLENSFIHCLMDSTNRVTKQNNLCRKVCGVLIGTKCNKGCQIHLATKERKGHVLLSERKIKDNIYDISAFYTKAGTCINLYPVEKQAPKIDIKELTNKEKQVVEMMVSGFKNKEILEILDISKSTLKTHINHIYQKIGDEFRQHRVQNSF